MLFTSHVRGFNVQTDQCRNTTEILWKLGLTHAAVNTVTHLFNGFLVETWTEAQAQNCIYVQKYPDTLGQHAAIADIRV